MHLGRTYGWLIAAIFATALVMGIALTGCGGGNGSGGLPSGRATIEQVNRGRYLVTSLGCSDCHNRGKDDPNDPNWLAGFIGQAGDQGEGAFQIGPFATYATNLTPDAATGIGMHSDRQIFNALKYGLDPMATPDVVITSTTPGQGNFPAQPHYLAPPMPWPSYRHLSDDDLWAIVAYLKHGIKPVKNNVPSSQGPPDFWASAYTADKVGPWTLPAYPAAGEAFSPNGGGSG
ncbi:MAG: hypothetical protein ACP5VE_00105 [Chthonomonadales bacterium]